MVWQFLFKRKDHAFLYKTFINNILHMEINPFIRKLISFFQESFPHGL